MDVSIIWHLATISIGLTFLPFGVLNLEWFSNNAAFVISLIALIFTIYSFYFMNWRKGQLIIGTPTTYAICVQPEEKGLFWVELPLSFYNNGASTQFVRNIRLILVQNGKESNKLYFDAIYKELPWSRSSNDAKRSYETAHQFAIDGRKVYSAVFAFGWRPGGIVLSVGRCKAKLEAKINNSDEWVEILEFDLIIRPLTMKQLHTLRPYYDDADISTEEFDNQELPQNML